MILKIAKYTARNVVILFLFLNLNSYAAGTLGGDFPLPFKSSNKTVELADGEVYFLSGKVFLTEGVPYLQVDLTQHSWLASAKRKAFPYYRIEGSTTYWAKYDGKNIKINVEANAKILQYGHQFSYEISLIPMSEPGVRAIP